MILSWVSSRWGWRPDFGLFLEHGFTFNLNDKGISYQNDGFFLTLVWFIVWSRNRLNVKPCSIDVYMNSWPLFVNHITVGQAPGVRLILLRIFIRSSHQELLLRVVLLVGLLKSFVHIDSKRRSLRLNQPDLIPTSSS